MPIYEYQCADCGQRIERLQRVSDPPPAACEACGGAMARLVSAPAFQFKGTGWYVTDYAGRKSDDAAGESSGAADRGDKADKPGAAEKGEQPKAEGAGDKVKPAAASGAAKTAPSGD